MNLARGLARPIARPIAGGLTGGEGGGPVTLISQSYLNPAITFTRASIGSYFDSAGALQSAAIDLPRYDHVPATLAYRGLLMEAEKTNILRYSEQLNNAAWTNNGLGSFGPDAIAAPDGATSADKLIEAATSAAHSLQNPSSTTTVQSYTYSVYCKAAERSKVMLYSLGADGKGTGFDLTGAGSTFTVPGIPLSTASSIASIGGGWYRCSITFTGAVATTNVGAIYILKDATAFSYLGDGVSGLYAWGAQLEAGAFATSYIKAVAVTVTRSADSAAFDIPSGIVLLTYTYEDDTTADVVVTPSDPYTIPASQKAIKSLIGYR